MNQHWTITTGPDSSRTRADALAAERIAHHLQAIEGDGNGGEILVGTPVSNPRVKSAAAAAGIDLSHETLGRDGFVLRSLAGDDGGTGVLLASATTFGVLCAWDEFRGRVRSASDLKRLDVTSVPAFPCREYRMSIPADDDFLIDRRINMVSMNAWNMFHTGFEGIYTGMKVLKEILGNRFKPEQWKATSHVSVLEGEFTPTFLSNMDRWYEELRNRMREIREMGVEVLATRYELGYPLPELCYGEFADECLGPSIHDVPVVCPSKPRTRELFRTVYHALLRDFPEIDGFYLFFSGEGGIKRCVCDECREKYRAFRETDLVRSLDLPVADSIESDDYYNMWAHNEFFDTVYAAIRELRPQATIIRNAWEFSVKTTKATEFASATVPRDVILRPYTTSGDTNLVEPPTPESAIWIRGGHRVSPKMCQLLEGHCRTQSFPNLFVSRIRDFYTQWQEEGVCGCTLHGGWLPSETTATYRSHEDNFGTGFNFVAHWKLMWDPNRSDLDEVFDDWLRTHYGDASAAVAKRALETAGSIYLMDDPVRPLLNDGRVRFSEFIFTMQYILLHNKFVALYMSGFGGRGKQPRFDAAFIRSQELLPGLYGKLSKSLELLGNLTQELRAHIESGDAHANIERLLRWFEVEIDYLKAIVALYKGQELRLLQDDPEAAAPHYGEAVRGLRSSLTAWSAVALDYGIWNFRIWSSFHPYYLPPVKPTEQGDWLDHGHVARFLERLESLADPARPELEVPHGTFPEHDTTGNRLALLEFEKHGPVA